MACVAGALKSAVLNPGFEPRIVTATDFVKLHGPSPITSVTGFDPSRNSVRMCVVFFAEKKSKTTSPKTYADTKLLHLDRQVYTQM